MPDLWPTDFGAPTETPPSAILQEQAELIARKTGGLIEGMLISSPDEAEFIHSFYLVVPTLGRYTFLLLAVRNPVALYPAKIFADQVGPMLTANNAKEFTDMLGHVLGHEGTRKIISSLLAQAKKK